MTREEQEELARLFERYRMRLWTMLRRKIGVSLQAKLEPEDILSEAYIRAERRWTARPTEPERHFVWLYGIVHDQYVEMVRKLRAGIRGGDVQQVSLPDSSAAELAVELWQSQTGASTLAERNEFLSRLQTFLQENLSPTELEIFLMRLFDRMEYPEIVGELSRRAVDGDRAADYQTILAELDARSGDNTSDQESVNKRRADAIRKRFTRAVGRLTSAILGEFPELLDALPRLGSEKHVS